MPFTASTLQIGGYHSYQHCKQLKSQSQSWTAVNGIPQVGHEGHTTCCLFVVVMHRGTFQWKGQYENAALDTLHWLV